MINNKTNITPKLIADTPMEELKKYELQLSKQYQILKVIRLCSIPTYLILAYIGRI